MPTRLLGMGGKARERDGLDTGRIACAVIRHIRFDLAKKCG